MCGWGEGVREGKGGRGSLGEWLRQCHMINEEGKSTQMNKISRLISVN